MDIVKQSKISGGLLQKLAALSSLLVMIIFFSFSSEYFLNTGNFMTIALQTAVIGIIAIGMTNVIITGGIDLSVGPILAFSGVMTGFALKAGFPIVIAIVVGIVSGTICGLLNGLLIAKANLPPFIATLGMMMALRGFALAITNGMPISGFGDDYANIAGSDLFGIPTPVIIFIVLVLIGIFILKMTRIGKHLYAVGSNEEAARLSGVNVFKTKLFAYGSTGFFCAISGIILSSRLISAQPTEGVGYELDAIAAVVIGGASLNGGKGTLVGTLIGAFIMSTLKNGLNMMNVSAFWQQVAIGLVVLGAVYMDQMRRKKGN